MRMSRQKFKSGIKSGVASVLSAALLLNPLLPAFASAEALTPDQIRARYENLLEQGKYLYQMEYEFGHDVCNNPNDPETCTLDPVGNKVCKNPNDHHSCHFEGLCVDHDTGAVLADTVVVDRSSLEKDQEPIVCAEKAKQLDEWNRLYQRDLAAIQAYEKQCPDCARKDDAEGAPGDIASHLALSPAVSSVAGMANEGPSCRADEHRASWESCKQEFQCDLASMVPGLTLALRVSTGSSCNGNMGKDCLAPAIAGILKDLTSNISTVWDLTKMGAGYLWGKIAGKPSAQQPNGEQTQAPPVSSVQTAVQGWKSFEQVENASSKKAMMATNTSEQDVVSFTKSPFQFMRNVADGIWNWMKQSVKESFACEKWEGAPYRSKCVQSLSNFECASCGQWMSTACGVVGVLGGEVLSWSVLAFGAGIGVEAVSKGLRATKALGKFAAGRGGQALEKITASLRARAMDATAEVVTKGAEAVRAVGSLSLAMIKGVGKIPFALWKKISATGSAIRESAVMKRIAAFTSGNKSALVLAKLAKSAPVRVVLKAGKLGIAPVRGYLYVFNKAGQIGFHLGTGTAMKAEVAALQAAAKAPGVTEGARTAMLSRAAGIKKSIQFLGEDLRKSVRTMPADLKRIGRGEWLPEKDEVAQAALAASREEQIQKAIEARYDGARKIEVDLEGVPLTRDQAASNLGNATEKVGSSGEKQLEIELGPECGKKPIFFEIGK